ncbi:MAG TPA: DUF1997 domain-containing protein [Leptolyngbyaceae cyanobacterium]
MLVRFNASQSVFIPVHSQPLPIQHYLKQPQRLVAALVDPRRTQELDKGLFRLSMRPLNFMTVHIQPIVDLKIWHGHGDTLYLKSARCEIRGNDYINQRFQLTLDGFLMPVTTQGGTHLEGTARLAVEVELPPPLWLTPRPLLESSGNGLLKSVLLTLKQRLSRQLLSDYYSWANGQQQMPLSGPEAEATLSSQTTFHI